VSVAVLSVMALPKSLDFVIDLAGVDSGAWE